MNIYEQQDELYEDYFPNNNLESLYNSISGSNSGILEFSVGEVIEESGLSVGVWVGIGVGGLVVLTVLVSGIYRCVTGAFCCMR